MNITETVHKILKDVVPELDSPLTDQVFDKVREAFNKREATLRIVGRHRKCTEIHNTIWDILTPYYNVAFSRDNDVIATVVKVGTAILIDNFIKHSTTQIVDDTNPYYLNLWLNEAMKMNNDINLQTLNKFYITQKLNNL